MTFLRSSLEILSKKFDRVPREGFLSAPSGGAAYCSISFRTPWCCLRVKARFVHLLLRVLLVLPHAPLLLPRAPSLLPLSSLCSLSAPSCSLHAS